MEASALYEAPFTSLHSGGPDALFYGRENVSEGILEKLDVVKVALNAGGGGGGLRAPVE
jgi:type I restriction enzyme R subunit